MFEKINKNTQFKILSDFSDAESNHELENAEPIRNQATSSLEIWSFT